MNKIKNILCIIIFLGTFICGCTKSHKDIHGYGNSNSNICNNGLVAKYNNNVYIRSSAINNEGENKKFFIYRSNENNMNKIAEDSASQPYINIIDNKVYYVGVNKDETGYCVYKMNLDGTNKKDILDGGELEFPIFIKDNNLFYVNYNDTNIEVLSYDLNNYKVKDIYYSIDISQNQNSISYEINNIAFDEENLYVKENIGSKSTIWKINLESKKKKELYKYISENDSTYIMDMTYFNKNIYYTLQDFEFGSSKLYKIDINKDKPKLITEKYSDSINIYENKIYFIDQDYNICNMDLNGLSRKIIKEIPKSDKNIKYKSQCNINICEGDIYFESYEINNKNSTSDENIYRVGLDGNNLYKIR